VRGESLDPLVVVAILNWNNLPDTLECLESVAAADYASLRVYVVDNASDVDPSPEIRARWPRVRIIRNAANLGYGGGNNVALRAASGEGTAYVLLLNNDATLAPDTVSRLVAVMEANPRVGMATPRIFFYDPPGEIYWDGGAIDWRTGETPHDSRSLPSGGGLIESEWLDGCALFVRTRTLDDIGLLDERYFLYYEDADWTVRAARAGWANVVVTDAVAWHKVSRSTGGYMGPLASFYYARNRYLFLRTHGRLARSPIPLVAYAPIIYRDYRRVTDWRESRLAVLQACWSLLRGRWGARSGRSAWLGAVLADFILGAATGRQLGRLFGLIQARARSGPDVAARR
jgi:GT2 family glycosyltransferase